MHQRSVSVQGGSTASSVQSTADTLIVECTHKLIQIITNARTTVGQVHVNRWFNLYAAESASLREKCDISLHNTMNAPLQINVCIVSPHIHNSTNQILLERWIIGHERTDITASNLASRRDNNELAVMYKRMAVLTRIAYTYTRLLPAFNLFKYNQLNSSADNPYAIDVSINNVLERPQLKFDGLNSSYSFTSVHTPNGKLIATVEYRTDCNFEFIQPVHTSIRSNVIHENYVPASIHTDIQYQSQSNQPHITARSPEYRPTSTTAPINIRATTSTAKSKPYSNSISRDSPIAYTPPSYTSTSGSNYFRAGSYSERVDHSAVDIPEHDTMYTSPATSTNTNTRSHRTQSLPAHHITHSISTNTIPSQNTTTTDQLSYSTSRTTTGINTRDRTQHITRPNSLTMQPRSLTSSPSLNAVTITHSPRSSMLTPNVTLISPPMSARGVTTHRSGSIEFIAPVSHGIPHSLSANLYNQSTQHIQPVTTNTHNDTPRHSPLASSVPHTTVSTGSSTSVSISPSIKPIDINAGIRPFALIGSVSQPLNIAHQTTHHAAHTWNHNQHRSTVLQSASTDSPLTNETTQSTDATLSDVTNTDEFSDPVFGRVDTDSTQQGGDSIDLVELMQLLQHVQPLSTSTVSVQQLCQQLQQLQQQSSDNI